MLFFPDSGVAEGTRHCAPTIRNDKIYLVFKAQEYLSKISLFLCGNMATYRFWHNISDDNLQPHKRFQLEQAP